MNELTIVVGIELELNWNFGIFMIDLLSVGVNRYNSGGKCFSQVHTKHLTVTIDAFTIHPGLWQGKKPSLPNRKDMTLVI